MRLLLTTDTIGGVWTYAVELAAAVRARDVHIALATMGDPLSPHQRRQLEPLDNVTLFQSQYKLEWMPDPWDDVYAAGRWLLDIERQFRPDVIHLNGYAHGSLAWKAPVLVAAHSCVLSWWQAVKGEAAPASWDRYRFEVRDGLRAAQLVVAPSVAMLDAAEALYGPFAATRVIYNGRTPSLFHTSTKEPFILSAGRLWDEAKNVAALARVAPRCPWPLLVAGDHHENPPPNVRTLGKLDQPALADLMARAAIYALPARYEPFGLSALEAALSGCALVLADIPSLREIWGDAAAFVRPNDDDALAATLNHLITDEPLRRQFANRARAHARHYTTARMAAAYFDAYSHLTSPDLPAPRLLTISGGFPACGS